MSTRSVLTAQLKLASAEKLDRREKLAGILRAAGALSSGKTKKVPAKSRATAVDGGTAQQTKVSVYRLSKLSAEQLAQVKVAARIINADVGLDAIIAHMKAAKARKVAKA